MGGLGDLVASQPPHWWITVLGRDYLTKTRYSVFQEQHSEGWPPSLYTRVHTYTCAPLQIHLQIHTYTPPPKRISALPFLLETEMSSFKLQPGPVTFSGLHDNQKKWAFIFQITSSETDLCLLRVKASCHTNQTGTMSLLSGLFCDFFFHCFLSSCNVLNS